MATAIVAGGCFWCTEAVLKRLRGISRVEPGYIGGTNPNPTYDEVCSGRSNHAEAVRVEFDPAGIDYRTILDVFFATHDPTTLNRQDNDVGTQYRSAIFPLDDEQAGIAADTIAELSAGHSFTAPIVTTIERDHPFYPAEGYHADYYDRNRSAGYCRIVIDPKITKLYDKYGSLTGA